MWVVVVSGGSRINGPCSPICPRRARYTKHNGPLCATCLQASIQCVQVTTHLPELLAGVLAADSLQDLGSTRVLFHKSIHLVYIVVDDDVQALVDASSLFNIVGGEFLRHVGGFRSGFWLRFAVRVDCGGKQAVIASVSADGSQCFCIVLFYCRGWSIDDGDY